jgi:hypothetical protein
MTACRPIFLVSIFVVLVASAVVSAVTVDEIPDVFDYTFEDADPIKIYAGPVTFAHRRHTSDHQITCNRCHHTLNEGDTAVQEHCRDCHTEPGFVRGREAEDMDEEMLLEHYLNALHAQCIGCHRELKMEDRQRKIPLGCTECHDRSRLPSSNR